MDFFPLLAFKKIRDWRKAWLTFNQHQEFFCSRQEAILLQQVPLLFCLYTRK